MNADEPTADHTDDCLILQPFHRDGVDYWPGCSCFYPKPAELGPEWQECGYLDESEVRS